MTIIEMLQQSVVLTIVGMFVVFFFLWFMTICISLAGKIINKSMKAEKPVPLAGETVKPEIIAAITAAVTKYKKERG